MLLCVLLCDFVVMWLTSTTYKQTKAPLVEMAPALSSSDLSVPPHRNMELGRQSVQVACECIQRTSALRIVLKPVAEMKCHGVEYQNLVLIQSTQHRLVVINHIPMKEPRHEPLVELVEALATTGAPRAALRSRALDNT